jgi:hypothetical protein
LACRGHHELVLENLALRQQQLAPSAMDAAFGADACRPPKDRHHHSHFGEHDGGREIRSAGAPRIHGELRTLGVEVSERTVSRLLGRRRRPPSQTWRTFLTNHVATLASIDFFTVPTLTGRVLFVLVVLLHHRQ